jgi:two-component system, OmpR family, phosphate regulon sensor histidine kinase PhoR
MQEFKHCYRNIILRSYCEDGDLMLGIMQLINPSSKKNKHKKIPSEYKEELQLQLLHINLQREIILCFVLLFIDIILLVLDSISTKCWSIDVHIYNYFSYLHIMLIIIPLVFLVLVYNKRTSLKLNFNLCRRLHWTIIFLVLTFCALISICNENIDILPYPYIIAMFCIASTLLLGKKERFAMYTFSYLLYIIGCFIIYIDFHNFIRNTFFITLLFILALIVSYIHYSSFINDFINQKIILDKNSELDKLYRATEETLKQRTAELNETVEYEKLRAAFFANISHELRTPLTVIFSAEQMMDLIMKREDFQNRNKDITQYMEVIKQNCYRLIRLVANLIDITKIDAGYFNVVLENCDIIKVVEDITLSVAAFIEGRNINLIFDTEIEELTIACDPDKIERIILNLLSNAVKFTPKDGSIYVNIFEKTDRVSIHIKDTGIGIPENMRQSIFERFVQVDKTISRKCEGSGIGLSLVKSLVDMHDGTIRLVSEEGKGSEFIIELPKRTAAYEVKTQEGNFINENQYVEKINIEFSDIYQ